ncbi:multidrug ABC transporter permease [Bifidobacterium dolichotidis]|uniref:Multidrug ABC transporter permease n=1 Tax=Bifidobacterium dolichotidis TaxID=2306976 RepID=A0A430FSB3_9BIFI|nr:ABC transporter permease [Bifidobacterium dolichotidis]RSX55755.1 multidrug ABC transporter permease [Bifidobacterium dolichotidis]
MWQTFLITMKTNLREKSALFWLFVFPIALATMFNGMFANLGEAYDIHPQPIAVVQDRAYCANPFTQTFITAISRNTQQLESSSACAPNTVQQRPQTQTLIDAHPVATTHEAIDLLKHDDGILGYIQTNTKGELSLTISASTAIKAEGIQDASDVHTGLSIINTALASFNQILQGVTAVGQQNPQLLANPQFHEQLIKRATASVTHEVTLTNFKPEEAARFFYALLGMAALMSMSFAINAVALCQANLSALGLRRSMSPQPKYRQLCGIFLASWLCCSIALIVSVAYIRFVCHVSVGGREGLAVISCIAAAFLATAMGILIGALPNLSLNVKTGIGTMLACILSLFSGLYGQFAMELSDQIKRNAPLLATLNPAQQITDLFYDILFYDSVMPFLRTISIVVGMAVICIAGASLMLRRHRYAHL